MTAENYKKLRKYEEELDLNRSIGLALLATDNGRTLDELSAVNEYFKRINAIRYHDYAVELMLDENVKRKTFHPDCPMTVVRIKSRTNPTHRNRRGV